MIAVFVVRRSADHGHEFLQLRRSASEFMAGSWQIVRGKIESGETAVHAALRELLEETGLTPIEFYALCSVETFFLASRNTIMHVPVFCAFVDDTAAVTLNEEHDASRWVPRLRMRAAITWASERAVLREVLDDLLPNSLAKPHLRVT
ncbi:MAG TPA: NUDIX domain-containing protein [Tepidisphaeraceae bacterium]|jgi:dATP pyrophosphohydrolase|nr:NUDIX domain-containing protein [Tepidisphaeraceae bacterium]